MGSCTRRHLLLSTCFLQMITIIERQVFDFLGYMWAPIFVNFLQILFIIFGFYGAYHFRIKYILTYLSWCFLWIGWNAFLICFYLDVGELSKDSDLLNLGTGSVSWFEVNGYGCKAIYPMNITSDDPFRPIRPERVDDCLLAYPLIEVIHSAVQCVLALFGILGAILISYIFLDEDDRFDFMNGDAKSPQHTVVHPMYVSYTSIPTSASATMLSSKHLHNPNHYNHHNNHNHQNHPNHLHHLATNHQQSHSYSNNTFLTHSNGNTPNASKNNTLTSSNRNLYYSPKNNKCFSQSSATTIMPPPQPPPPTTTTLSSSAATAAMQLDASQQQPEQRYYDDSTAKADHQLYSNSQQQRQQLLMLMSTNALSPTASLSTTSSNPAYQQRQQQQQSQQQHHFMNLSNANLNTNNYYNNYNNNNTNTNSSLSYASLQKCSNQNSVEFLSSNSNSNLTMAGSICSNTAPEPGTCVSAGGGGGVGVSGGLALGTLSSSNYSISNSLHDSSGNNNSNNNNNNGNNTGNRSGNRNCNNNNNSKSNNKSSAASGRFARIHAKPKAPKSTYHNNSTTDGNKLQQHHRYDMPTISSIPNDAGLEEHFQQNLDDDIISVQNFKSDAITYVPFQKPVPGSNSYLSGSNNNPSYASLNSIYSGNNNSGTINSESNISGSNSTTTPTPTSNNVPYNNGLSPNNNNNNNSLVHLGQHLTRDNSHFFMRNNNDLLLERQDLPPSSSRPSAAAILNPAARALYQQNGLPFQKHQPHSNPSRPSRPSNIPLPTMPHLSSYPHSNPSQNSAHSPLSPSAVTPPPPPAPRPHIFTPRSGHAPYPDLSPEVAEKYAMPTQYVPRSPIPSRIARRQRQQHERERSHFANTSANFCDQIRDTPPGYIGTGSNIMRAKSYDRLYSSGSSCKITGRSEHTEHLECAERSDRLDRSSNAQAKTSLKLNAKDAAPQVNRRSGRSGVKARPRSYCNSMVGAGEGAIRGNGASGGIGAVVGRSSGGGEVVYS